MSSFVAPAYVRARPAQSVRTEQQLRQYHQDCLRASPPNCTEFEAGGQYEAWGACGVSQWAYD